MRVVHVITGLGTGGAERSLAEMLSPLAARGVESTVVCLRRRVEGVERSVVDAGHDVRFIDGGSAIRRARAVREIASEVRAAVVHTTIFEADLVGRIAMVGTGTPVMTSLVNPSYGEDRRRDPNIARWRLELVRAVDGWTARRLTSHFLAISAAVADAARRSLRIRADRITVLPRGRDPERLLVPDGRRAAVRSALGISADAPIVLHVGRHEYQKGIDVLLRAAPALHARRPDLVVLQAGRDGAASPLLDQLAARLSPGAVRFLGHRDDIPDLMASADVFVFPSRFEGLGGSLIEAQALGLPIVATDLPAIREVVESGATADLVQPEEPTALAAAVLALVDDPRRRERYGQRAREVFSERFTIDLAADRTAALLRDVAARGRRGERLSPQP